MGDPRDEHGSPAEAPTIDIKGRDSPDSFDDVLKRVVRGPAAPGTSMRQLEPGTELAGRFMIERVLGAGGMGTVYGARDRSLGRAVAIKLHHAAGGAVRLRREAIAMARLAHPNVVTVFEVGELERRPFVVMEYVAGTTLREWLAAAPRPVERILAILIAAGEGLAAAHDAGLIHRDIKPDNVLIGNDGRARVGDFGLARELDSEEDAPAASADADPASQLLRPMTMTGTVLGTPAYMAPEQFEGVPVEASADQFAFCVVAWEALWGERPFAGATVDELRDALAKARRRPPPPSPKVPSRIRAALERGLATDPAARFPTMHELLAALRAPARRRRRIAAGVTALAGLIAAGAVAGAGLMGRDDEPSCDDAGAPFVRRIPRDLAARLRAAGATEAAERVDGAVSDYVAGLDAHARASCRADLPPQLARNSRVCLEIAAQVAARILDVESVTPASAPALVKEAVALPRPDACVEPSHLAAMRPIPEDQLDAIVAARVELQLGLLDRRVRDPAKLERLARTAQADPVAAAGLVMFRGLAAIDGNDLVEANKLLSDAYYAARALDDDELTAAVLGHLISLELDYHLDRTSEQMWLRTALADAERFHVRSPWLAGRLYLHAAHAAEAGQDAAAATKHLARARELFKPGDPGLLEVMRVEAALDIQGGRVAAGIARYEQAIAGFEQRLGATHPSIGTLNSDLGALLLNHGQSEKALAFARRAVDILEKSPDPSRPGLDAARANLGAMLSENGRDAEARPLLEQARLGMLARTGKANANVAFIDTNLSLIYMAAGEIDRAIEVLDEGVAILEREIGPDRIEVAEALYNLAVAHRKKRDHATALRFARRCAAIYAAKTAGSDRHRNALAHTAAIANDMGDHEAVLADTQAALALTGPAENPLATAWPQLERARALVATRRFAEARPLIATARAVYAKQGLAERVTELDALAGKLR